MNLSKEKASQLKILNAIDNKNNYDDVKRILQDIQKLKPSSFHLLEKKELVGHLKESINYLKKLEAEVD